MSLGAACRIAALAPTIFPVANGSTMSVTNDSASMSVSSSFLASFTKIRAPARIARPTAYVGAAAGPAITADTLRITDRISMYVSGF